MSAGGPGQAKAGRRLHDKPGGAATLSLGAERRASQAEHSGQWDNSCGRERGDHCLTASCSTDVSLQPLALALESSTHDNPALAQCSSTPTLVTSRHTHTEDERGLPPHSPLRHNRLCRHRHQQQTQTPPTVAVAAAATAAATNSNIHHNTCSRPVCKLPTPLLSCSLRPHFVMQFFPIKALKTTRNRRTRRPDPRVSRDISTPTPQKQ